MLCVELFALYSVGLRLKSKENIVIFLGLSINREVDNNSCYHPLRNLAENIHSFLFTIIKG